MCLSSFHLNVRFYFWGFRNMNVLNKNFIKQLTCSSFHSFTAETCIAHANYILKWFQDNQCLFSNFPWALRMEYWAFVCSFFLLFFFLFVCFQTRVSLCSPGWTEIWYVYQTNFGFTGLGLKLPWALSLALPGCAAPRSLTPMASLCSLS